ncbi:MAG TPA: pitrilysin family protein [Patescibacteria group bacterium]|nr:pitrilysin family protein [Patescibacteria group bacterium]
MTINRTLKNGMQAILVPQKGATSMTVMVFVKVGSRYEKSETSGASHFVEHLMFKGTKRRPHSLMITKELDRYGAEFNAYTSKDMTVYFIKMDAAKTDLAIDILHDMLFHSLFNPEEVNRERGVIIEEINMYEDNPRAHVEDLLEEVLFPNNTLSWPIIGPRAVIKKISRDELKTYHDTYYIPSRMTVVVSGKIIPGIWNLLQKTFGSVHEPAKPADAPFLTFEKPAVLARPFTHQQKKTEQINLAIAFHGLPYGHKQMPAMNLLATILGGSMSSRLFMEVRERRGLCYSISASHQPLEDIGAFSIMAGLDKSRIHEAIKVIWQELEKTIKESVKADELRRAKDHLRGRIMLSFEDSANQADWYGKQWMFQKKLLTPEERLRQMEKVTAADIRAIAKQTFRKESMAAAVVGPFKTKDEVAHLFKID